jgi:hypothetical protein
MTRTYDEAIKLARGHALALAAALNKYAVPVEGGPRKKTLRHVNPLNTPDDAGASYGSNYGVVS